MAAMQGAFRAQPAESVYGITPIGRGSLNVNSDGAFLTQGKRKVLLLLPCSKVLLGKEDKYGFGENIGKSRQLRMQSLCLWQSAYNEAAK